MNKNSKKKREKKIKITNPKVQLPVGTDYVCVCTKSRSTQINKFKGKVAEGVLQPKENHQSKSRPMCTG